jgi:hypothetical protein
VCAVRLPADDGNIHRAAINAEVVIRNALGLSVDFVRKRCERLPVERTFRHVRVVDAIVVHAGHHGFKGLGRAPLQANPRQSPHLVLAARGNDANEPPGARLESELAAGDRLAPGIDAPTPQVLASQTV